MRLYVDFFKLVEAIVFIISFVILIGWILYVKIKSWWQDRTRR